MKDLSINLKVKVTEEEVSNILVTAFEGGINYWCNSAKPETHIPGMYASDALNKGINIILIVDEDEPVTLTPENFRAGLKRFIEEEGLGVLYEGELDCSKIDANDTDIIIQYAVFKKIIYG